MDVIKVAQRIRDESYDEVRAYMPKIAPRLAATYLLPMLLAGVVTIAVMWLVSTWLSPIVASALPLTISLIVIIATWRIMESRYHATGLLVMYTHYSSNRRKLDTLLEQAEQGDYDETNLLAAADLTEETANTFVMAAQEQNIQPVDEAERG